MRYRTLKYALLIIFFFLTLGSYSAPIGTLSAKAMDTLPKEEISRLFHEANTMFADANRLSNTDPEAAMDLYRKSLLRYKKIVNQGNIENGKLYYNIGNIYFKTQDIGRAILNYLKAEQYIGNDINLQRNLEFARNVRKDRIEVKQETKILKTLFFWHYDLSSKTRLILFTIAFCLLWFFAAARIFLKKPVLKWMIGTALFLSLLFAGSLGIEYLNLKQSIPGVIINEEVVARKGNSISYEPSFKKPLHAGTEFTLVENRGTWVQVKLQDGRTCWLPKSAIALVR